MKEKLEEMFDERVKELERPFCEHEWCLVEDILPELKQFIFEIVIKEVLESVVPEVVDERLSKYHLPEIQKEISGYNQAIEKIVKNTKEKYNIDL